MVALPRAVTKCNATIGKIRSNYKAGRRATGCLHSPTHGCTLQCLAANNLRNYPVPLRLPPLVSFKAVQTGPRVLNRVARTPQHGASVPDSQHSPVPHVRSCSSTYPLTSHTAPPPTHAPKDYYKGGASVNIWGPVFVQSRLTRHQYPRWQDDRQLTG